MSLGRAYRPGMILNEPGQSSREFGRSGPSGSMQVDLYAGRTMGSVRTERRAMSDAKRIYRVTVNAQ
jgi:hypothetical protein